MHFHCIGAVTIRVQLCRCAEMTVSNLKELVNEFSVYFTLRIIKNK